MRYFGLVLILAMAVAWLCGGWLAIYRGLRRRPWSWRTPVSMIAAVCCVYGVLGFLGAGVASMGGLDWLGSYEWPIGYTSGAMRTHGGDYIVPHLASGRVQIYDANLRFLRGWRIESDGGTFTARTTPNDNIEIYTARGDAHLIYDLSGRLLSESTYDGSRSPSPLDRPANAISVRIPTPWWLWPVSGPFYSWLFAALFLVLWNVSTDKRDKNKWIARRGRSA